MGYGWSAAIVAFLLAACGRTGGEVEQVREAPSGDARAPRDALAGGGPADAQRPRDARVESGRSMAAGSPCGFGADPQEPVLALAATFDRQLVFVFTDGVTRVVHRFSAPSVSDRRFEDMRATIAANPSRVAVTLTTDVQSSEGVWEGSSETVLVTPAGNVVWQQTREHPAHTHREPLLGDSGVLTTGEEAVMADGRVVSLGEYRPVAEAFAGDVVPVTSSDGELGWLALPTGTFVRADVQPDPSRSFRPIRAGGALVYFAAEQRSLVVARPGTPPREIPLPTDAADSQVDARDGWLMLSHPVDGGRWRVDLERGVVDPIELVAPEGRRLFRNSATGQPTAILDDAGNVLALFRDEVAGAVYRSPDGTAPWLPVSQSFAHVNTVRFDARGGTYLLHVSERSFFQPPEDLETEWSAPPAEAGPTLVSPATGVSRPEAGVEHTVPGYSSVRLSEDGHCAAYWERATEGRTEDVLHAVDMDRGAVAEVLRAPAERVFQGRDIAWVVP